MRILIVGLNFHPELTGIGKYTAELAAHLSSEGYQVHVVTTPPYYPYWQVRQGYKGWQYKGEEWEGIQILRAPIWVPHKPTGLKRLIHLLSFAVSSFPLLLGQLGWHPDLVICIVPAFFSAPFALLTARLSGAKAWLHIQDFELDAATKLGMLPSNNIMVKIASLGERWLLTRFDRVSTISNQMLVRLKEKGVGSERAYLFPNWVDTNLIFPILDSRDSLRKTLGISHNKIVVLYSGNMGYKQGLDCIIDVARQLQANSNILFVLCGDGTAREMLEKVADGLLNIQFLSLQPLENLNQLLNTADIHILPQRAGAADLVMPSKLLGMLASGKAIIATADSDTELGNIVGQIGMLVPPDDGLALSSAILELAGSPELRSQLGEKGREYVCAHWSADQVLSQFQAQLLNLVNKNPLIVASKENTFLKAKSKS
jgi:colanic acid biosynthesis glycosyl transferase WcaI